MARSLVHLIGTIGLYDGTESVHKPSMDAQQLERTLTALGLSRAQAAVLLGVTSRAVNRWCASEREIPGPVIAYLRLLGSLSPALLAQELARLQAGDATMYDGMYLVTYAGTEGSGFAVLNFMDGIVWGHDMAINYDGTYRPSLVKGYMDVELTLTVPPGVPLASGKPAMPVEYRFPVRVTIPARGTHKFVVGVPDLAVVDAEIAFLRPLPALLAA